MTEDLEPCRDCGAPQPNSSPSSLIVWLLLDYFEGGDTYTVEGVYASRDGAVAAFQQIANRAIKDNADDTGVEVDVEWDDENHPVIHEGDSAWYFSIEQAVVNP